MRKESLAARAQGSCDQNKTRRVEPGIGVQYWNPERTGHCTYLPESRNIPGSVYSARGALVRQVPLAEEPAESAAKKRQCDRRHLSKEHDECATRTSVTGGWPGRDFDPSLKDRWGIHRWFLKECCRTHRPDANDRERCKGERQCGEDSDRRKEHRESCYCQGTRDSPDYERPS